MVKRQLVSYSYTCDVCGDAIPDTDGDGATRKVTWEGSDYVLDVCSTHGEQLGELLSQLKSFVESGTRSSGRRGRRAAAVTAASRTPRGRRAATSTSAGTSPKRGDLGAVRAWARENGQKVSERGRIPGELLAAYDAAHAGSAAESARSAAAETASPAEVDAPSTAAPRAPKAPRGRRAAASTSAGTSPKRGDLGAVRAWARENGQKVSERGRIPGELLAAYDAAQNGSAPAPAPAAAARKRRPRKAAAPSAG